jgi:hypothetical protein
MSWAKGKRGHPLFHVRVRPAAGLEREFEAHAKPGGRLLALAPVRGPLFCPLQKRNVPLLTHQSKRASAGFLCFGYMVSRQLTPLH